MVVPPAGEVEARLPEATQGEALRHYAAFRGWKAQEFVDAGHSGRKDSRPGLDALLAAVRRGAGPWRFLFPPYFQAHSRRRTVGRER